MTTRTLRYSTKERNPVERPGFSIQDRGIARPPGELTGLAQRRLVSSFPGVPASWSPFFQSEVKKMPKSTGKRAGLQRCNGMQRWILWRLTRRIGTCVVYPLNYYIPFLLQSSFIGILLLQCCRAKFGSNIKGIPATVGSVAALLRPLHPSNGCSFNVCWKNWRSRSADRQAARCSTRDDPVEHPGGRDDRGTWCRAAAICRGSR